METEPTLRTMILLLALFPFLAAFATIYRLGTRLGIIEQLTWLVAAPVVWVMTVLLSPVLGMFVIKKSIEAYCEARR